jgi:hypothetical protein
MASEAEHGLIEGDVAQLVVHSKPKNTGDFLKKKNLFLKALIIPFKHRFSKNKQLNVMHLSIRT